jgi:hypothetical protein
MSLNEIVRPGVVLLRTVFSRVQSDKVAKEARTLERFSRKRIF